MPRLEAEEGLKSIQLYGAGSGNMKKSGFMKIIKDLTRQARGGRRPKARKMNSGDLSSMNIKSE